MQSNYKKNTKYMLYSIIMIPLIVWLISLILLFSYRPLYKAAAYWVEGILTIKDYNFQRQETDKAHMFFISGSNSLFGISTKILEERFDYSIHNLATHAGFPIDFHFNLVKKYAKKGDIVIAPLEYNYINSKSNLNAWTYAQFTTWATQYQSLLSPEMRNQIFWRNMYSYWERLPFIYRPLPIIEKESLILHNVTNNTNIFSPEAYNVLALTRDGEFFMDSPLVKFSENLYITSDEANPHFIQELMKFNEYAKKSGIKFYVTYPVSVKNKQFDADTQETQERLKKYRQIYKNIGVNLFGDERFYNFDKKYFRDIPYHLNATGAALRSLLLAEDINTHVLGKEPSYDVNSKAATDKFFKQKEKEALKIIDELRILDKEKKEKKTM